MEYGHLVKITSALAYPAQPNVQGHIWESYCRTIPLNPLEEVSKVLTMIDSRFLFDIYVPCSLYNLRTQVSGTCKTNCITGIFRTLGRSELVHRHFPVRWFSNSSVERYHLDIWKEPSVLALTGCFCGHGADPVYPMPEMDRVPLWEPLWLLLGKGEPKKFCDSWNHTKTR